MLSLSHAVTALLEDSDDSAPLKQSAAYWLCDKGMKANLPAASHLRALGAQGDSAAGGGSRPSSLRWPGAQGILAVQV